MSINGEKMDLITIIVPVYNVEKYLRSCLDSIVEQTYKELQIILIDDGSIDKSGEICDEYAQRDDRIEVIHKKNEGQSIARNIGLDKARGRYVTFADSDDIVDRECISFLFKQMKAVDADMSICRYKRFVDISDIKDAERSEENIVYNKIEALKILLYSPEKIPQSPYAKLYKKELFDQIRFPERKINEDIGTIYKIIWKSEKIAYNPSQYYYYLQRAGSTVRSRFSEKKMAAVDFAEEILAFVRENTPEIEKAAICYALSQNVQVLMKLPNRKSEYQKYKKILWRNIKQYRKIVIMDSQVSWKRRIGALSTYGGAEITKALGKLYKIKVNHEEIL